MKVLIIDNTIDQDCWGGEELRHLTHVAKGATVTVRRAPHEDLPLSPRGYDRVIVSGSKTSVLDDAPWISKLHEFVQMTLNENTPFLGICYGHQTLARVLAGKSTCKRAEVLEFGWTKIEVLDDGSLLRGLPKSFHSFSAHYEEVVELPKGFKCLASSEACSIQAFQLQEKPVFGIQFHPEREIANAENDFAKWKKAKSPKTLLNTSRSKSLYDAKIGELIFKNFLEVES